MKKLLKVIPFIILIAGIIALVIIYFNYYKVKFVLQNTSISLEVDTDYCFKLNSANVDFLSQDSNIVSFDVELENLGKSPSFSPQVYITFTNLSTSVPKVIACDVDLKNIKKGATATATIQLDIAELGVGSYNTYISIWDNQNGQYISLSNPYRNTRDGYYFGILHVTHFRF